MDFSDALKELRKGASIAREGWNGKDMFIFLAKTSSYSILGTPISGYSILGTPLPPSQFISSVNGSLLKILEGATDLLPAFFMKDAQGRIVTGWLASQTDMLADDWVVVHPVVSP
jgi:hypothetical protein